MAVSVTGRPAAGATGVPSQMAGQESFPVAGQAGGAVAANPGRSGPGDTHHSLRHLSGEMTPLYAQHAAGAATALNASRNGTDPVRGTRTSEQAVLRR